MTISLVDIPVQILVMLIGLFFYRREVFQSLIFTHRILKPTLYLNIVLYQNFKKTSVRKMFYLLANQKVICYPLLSINIPVFPYISPMMKLLALQRIKLIKSPYRTNRYGKDAVITNAV